MMPVPMKLTVQSKADSASGGVFTIGQSFDHEGLALMHLASLASATNILMQFLDSGDLAVDSDDPTLDKVKISEVANADIDHASLATSLGTGSLCDFTASATTRAWNWLRDIGAGTAAAYTPDRNVKASTLVRDALASNSELAQNGGKDVILLTQEVAEPHVYMQEGGGGFIEAAVSASVEVCVLVPGGPRDFGE